MQSLEPLPEVVRAIERGEQWLLGEQAPDGTWQDYELPHVGASRDWVTAFVGLALADVPRRRASARALSAAANALHAGRSAGGFRYNARAGLDADSTAWAFRLLAALDDRRTLDPVHELAAFLNERGEARTYLDTARQGEWAGAHADVTPVVGLSLVEAEAPTPLVLRVRGAVLAALDAPGAIEAYWWACPSYAMAQSLVFLRASGGVPEGAAARLRGALESLSPADNTVDASMRLLAGVCLGLVSFEKLPEAARVLLDMQEVAGSFPASPALRLPDPTGRGAGTVHADVRRRFSTAAAVAALKTFLRAAPRRAHHFDRKEPS